MFAAALGLIADMADYGKLNRENRNEAVYYGIYGVVRKTGWALCSLLLSWVHSTFGYSAAEPLGVRMIWMLCAVTCVAGLLLFFPYRRGDSRDNTRRVMGL